MILSKPLVVALLVTGVPLFATAADPTSQQPATFNLKSAEVGSGESTTASAADRYDLPNGAATKTSPAFSQALDSQGNICYTMRSYKVKPKERFSESESAGAGYTTCEMASAYRLRSADGVSSTRQK